MALCKVILTILASLTAGGSATEIAQFEKARVCPVNSTSSQWVTVGSKNDCPQRCVAQKTCNAFHFSNINGSCFLGDACATVTQWTPGDCDSFKYADASDGQSTGSSGLLSQLQMKLFYRFKKSGLVNEANPRQFCLTAHDVILGSDGAEFKGYTGSYLRIETPGFEQFLGYGRRHSAFVMAKIFGETSGSEYFDKFHQCDSADSYASTFARTGRTVIKGGIVTTAGGSSVSKVRYLLPDDGELHLVSLGTPYNGTVYEDFYYNGTLVQLTLLNALSSVASVDQFQCLSLGLGHNNATCLTGKLHCYGLSTGLLSADEFRLLEQHCLGV